MYQTYSYIYNLSMKLKNLHLQALYLNNLLYYIHHLKKAYIQGIEYVTKGVNPADYDWMIIDADNRKMSDELKIMLEEAVHQPVEQHEFKAIIMSHTGQGTIGFGRIKKIKY